jgi:hypothetical protein
MRKTLATILIAVAIALSGNAPAAGDARDLWIGVVGLSDPYGNYARRRGSTAVDPSTVLRPIAALIGGNWWFTSYFQDDTVDRALRQALGKEPAQWLPPGTALPSNWQARLFDNRRVKVRATGPLRRLGDGYDENTLVVNTDLKLTRARFTEPDVDAHGVATAGDVRVELFEDLPASTHAELLRFVEPNLQKEIQRRVNEAKGIELEFPNDPDAKQMLGLFASAPFEVTLARTAIERGAPVYVIEGAKAVATKSNNGISIHTGAAARRDRAGALHMIGAWSYLNTNDNAHGNHPLAVLERNGESCWLIAHTLEGGYEYVLTGPGQIDPEKFTFTCDIK